MYVHACMCAFVCVCVLFCHLFCVVMKWVLCVSGIITKYTYTDQNMKANNLICKGCSKLNVEQMIDGDSGGACFLLR